MLTAIGFIAIVCLQVFSSGHKHVVVVEDNISLTNENKALTNENKGLKQSVSNLESKNQELTDDKKSLQQMVSEVIGDLDSTKTIVKKIKNELNDEKSINRINNGGREFDFQPIKLPDSEGN